MRIYENAIVRQHTNDESSEADTLAIYAMAAIYEYYTATDAYIQATQMQQNS